MANHEISYGDKVIKFQLKRKDVKNININVKPDMTVLVSAKEEVPLDYIKDIIKDKATWILDKMEYFKGAQAPDIKKEYISGESIKYLGRQYRLKVVGSEEEYVKYYKGYIYLYIKDKKNYLGKKELINNWFKTKAEKIFNNSLDKMYPKIKKYGVERPSISIKRMKTRWGSCVIDNKKIILNYDLIKAPKHCIDYVVLHELIHFRYSHHNQDFYYFLTAQMPDWKQRKKILDEEIVREL